MRWRWIAWHARRCLITVVNKRRTSLYLAGFLILMLACGPNVKNIGGYQPCTENCKILTIEVSSETDREGWATAKFLSRDGKTGQIIGDKETMVGFPFKTEMAYSPDFHFTLKVWGELSFAIARPGERRHIKCSIKNEAGVELYRAEDRVGNETCFASFKN